MAITLLAASVYVNPSINILQDTEVSTDNNFHSNKSNPQESISYDHNKCELVQSLTRSFSPPTALISYPGSGSDWFRTLIEKVTGYKTESIGK